MVQALEIDVERLELGEKVKIDIRALMEYSVQWPGEMRRVDEVLR